jgi:hypothetical protein
LIFGAVPAARYNGSSSLISMSPAEVLLYTPLVQFLMLYGVLYRHELSRLVHPLKEKTGVKAWGEAFEKLGLVDHDEVEYPHDPRARKFVLEMVLPTALLSTLCPELFLQVILVLVPASEGAWGPLLFLLQFIPAAYFLAFLHRNYLGPLPIHRHRTTLPLPRMSSMVRCLREKKGEGI